MVKRLLLSLLIVFILGNYVEVKAQDPHFSQFYANSLYLNPALTGAEICPRVSLSYRNQWPALGPTYVTYSVGYDQYLNFLQGGVGLYLMNDVQGGDIIETTTISGMYSYTLAISQRFYMAGGFQASYVFKKINWDFIFPDMIHPLYGPIWSTRENPDDVSEGRNYPDFSIGLVGFSERAFFGMAVHHITEPSESFLRGSDAVLPRKFTAHFGTDVSIRHSNFRRGDLIISPQILYHQQSEFQQFNWGLYVTRVNIVAGFWFRQNFNFQYDAFNMLAGFRQDNIKIAYSYDLTISRLRNATYGAHEVSVSYRFPCPEQRTRRTTISCPMF